jgi:hypothetical protein
MRRNCGVKSHAGLTNGVLRGSELRQTVTATFSIENNSNCCIVAQT